MNESDSTVTPAPATAPTDAKVHRKRGRPVGSFGPKRRAQATGTSYNGPSLAQVEAMSDEAVAEAFKQFGVEPKRYTWFTDWCTLDELDGTKREISEEDWHRGVHRNELMILFVRCWINSLDDTKLLAILEEATGECMSESQTRYLLRADLIEKVHQATWQEIHKATDQRKK